jgi:DNA-binding GntR family transcriptional regulator
MLSVRLADRPNISETAAQAVRRMIVDGRLAAGSRINEVHLAGSLGVSRTPLREALSRLVAEGALVVRPRLGMFVRPFTVEEFEQLYDLRPLLDPEALRRAGVPPPPRIAELDRLNRKLAGTRDPELAIALDDEWHRGLLAGCSNRVLLEMIDHLILRTRRYELALMRESSNVMRATADHARILDALRHGNLRAACAALRHNLQSGRAPIIAWLEARAAPPGS